jgi:uncharacterized membrane protein
MMTREKWYPKVAGALFLLAFVGGISAIMLADLNVSTDLPTDVARNKDRVLQASIGLIIMGFACAGIAPALYPVLKEQHPASAIGSVVFRGIESVFHFLIPICYILMSVVAQKMPYAEANAVLQVMQEKIKIYVLIATIAWGIGAMLYYYALFKSHMIPRALSIWGLIAMPLAVISALCVFFLRMDSSSPFALALNSPIAFQEIAMAIWLIFKGVKIRHKEK